MEPKWILLDTTGQGCHVGLYHQGQLSQLSDYQPQSHTKQILPMIEQLLTQADLAPQDLTGIIYTQGPGSFTGVRVGVSVVQGLAFGLSIPTLGVSTLMTLAWQGHIHTQKDVIGAVMDARMGQVYWAVYDCALGCQAMTKDALTTVLQLSEHDLPAVIAGEVNVFESASVKRESTQFLLQSQVSINALLNLVETGLSHGFLTWDSAFALPIYLRNDVAHLPKK